MGEGWGIYHIHRGQNHTKQDEFKGRQCTKIKILSIVTGSTNNTQVFAGKILTTKYSILGDCNPSFLKHLLMIYLP